LPIGVRSPFVSLGDGAGVEASDQVGGEVNSDVPNSAPTGAFNPTSSISSGEGLGIFADSQVAVTQKGFDLVSNHLSQFGDFPPNQMMLDRLQAAMDAGNPITGADAVFYTHEASEATMMARGMSYDEAHAAALQKYGVSPYSVYHPDVIQANPGWLNQNWRNFWGIHQ
jgi:hypothetical protein